MTGDLIYEMISINDNDTRRINHAFKVYSYSKCIAEREGVDGNTLSIIEAAAVLHDIAIRHCERVYGSASGKLQEKEGPLLARPILEKYSEDTAFIERVLYLIAHHHTYENIDGIDYQVLIEADFLVNFEEGDISKEAFKKAIDKFFTTGTAKDIARAVFKG